VDELAYQDIITEHLPGNEYFGDTVREKLVYYPTVTREEYHTMGRVTDLLAGGKLCDDIGLPHVSPGEDRFMICGSPSMLKDFTALLDSRGFRETRNGELGHYVVERAFVEQ
jgi:ferredoxin--NADP+ reductase